MQPTKCKIFLKGFCPRKELCQNSHDIKNCMSGPNCTIKNQCPDRHPPLCKNFVKNTCGFFVGNKFIVFSNCAFFHPPGVNQVPPSTSSVMLTTTAPNTIIATAPATGQNTPPDARSEIEVNSGISPANQVNSTTKDVVEENPNKKSPAHIPQIHPTSMVKSQNDDASRETREEAVLLVQGGQPTPLPPPQLAGNSKTITQLQTDLGAALTQITKLEELTVQLQKSLKQQAELISSNTTQIARLYNNMDYRIQGKILPRILDMEEYLQQLKKSESKVITTAPPWIRTAPKHCQDHHQ